MSAPIVPWDINQAERIKRGSTVDQGHLMQLHRFYQKSNHTIKHDCNSTHKMHILVHILMYRMPESYVLPAQYVFCAQNANSRNSHEDPL